MDPTFQRKYATAFQHVCSQRNSLIRVVYKSPVFFQHHLSEQIIKYCESIKNCLLAGYILAIEEASVASRIFLVCTIVFLCLVFLDKRLTFSKVIGMEHMLRMKNFSTSDIHFNITIFIPIVVVGLCVGIFNTFFKGQQTKTVSTGCPAKLHTLLLFEFLDFQGVQKFHL